MNKIVEAINAIKSSLKYHWSLFKNTITVSINVESEYLKFNWTDTFTGVTLARLMPTKRFSEIFKDLINVIKAYLPEEKEEIDEFVKELDKRAKLDIVTYNALCTLLENKYEIDYQNGVLTISITKGEFYFILTINEEFLRSLKEVVDDTELLMDCVPSFIKEWIEEEEEKKNSKKNKFKDQVMKLYQEYAEFLDEDSKDIDFSDKYWEIIFVNPDKNAYPKELELDWDSEDYDIERASKYLSQWKKNLPKIQEQKEREKLIKEIENKYPSAITYEGWDIYKVKVNVKGKTKMIDKEKTDIKVIKGILEELKQASAKVKVEVI